MNSMRAVGVKSSGVVVAAVAKVGGGLRRCGLCRPKKEGTMEEEEKGRTGKEGGREVRKASGSVWWLLVEEEEALLGKER